MWGRALRRAARGHGAAMEEMLLTGRDATGGAVLSPLLWCLAVGAGGVARCEEEASARTDTPSVDVAMHGRRLNVRVNTTLGQPTTQQEGEGQQQGKVTTSSRYVIVGYGVAGSAALRALLEVEPDADVLVVEAGHVPKDKDGVPLHPRAGGGSSSSSFLGFRRKYPSSVKYMWDTSVQAIDVDQKVLHLSNGERVGYNKVLLAMGPGPMEIPARHVQEQVADRVMQLQGQSDREALADLVAVGQHVTVLGSSWNAVELANHLSDVARQHGWSSSVTLIFPEGAPMAKQLPRSLAGLLLRRLERRGVEILAHTSVKYVGHMLDWDLAELGRIKAAGGGGGGERPLKIYLCSKFESLDTGALLTDRVVLVGSSIQGTKPAIEFTGRALEVDERTGAVVVNHELMASSSVLVAGDAAYFPCQTLGRMTVRSVDHSYHSGFVAGLNLTGKEVRYSYMPIYFGAIPRLGVRAVFVGTCDSSFETHGFWWKNGRRRERDTTEAENEASREEATVVPAEESLTDKVKGSLKRVLGGQDGGKSVALSPSEENQGRGAVIGSGANRDSHVGRRLGMRRFSTTTTTTTSSSPPPEGGGGGGATLKRTDTFQRSQQSFVPVNGTGVVFYVNGAGALRGVLLWGMPSGDDNSEEGGVEAIDEQLGTMIDRVKGLIQAGVKEGVVFKYDINSRPDTVATLRALAMDVVRPDSYDLLSNKAPLYSYASARQLATNGDDPIFRSSTNSKSAADQLEAAYENVVRRKNTFS